MWRGVVAVGWWLVVFTVVVFEGGDSFREDMERGLESVRKKRRVLRRSGEAQYTNVHTFL